MSATGKTGVKRRKVHTIEFKYQAIIEVEKVRQQTAIAKELGISPSTLATWVENADKIKSGYLEFENSCCAFLCNLKMCYLFKCID